ncbi:IS3 family transposase [Abyssalbus ytuae]|uniref:IS3 family transposase n=1 Tax=Abyssalbus ytuae TaxID=2926907 RepID=A0A9E7A074_9FLAO|nr:IS3 family transposase [Abyssalbus ytuae]UOB18412.1 IS3 family transposase [Abyssalbus ytuae]
MAKKYDYEFKTMIVELLQSGQSVKSVSNEYGLNGSMIRKWRKCYEENIGGFTTTKELSEEQKRIQLLEKELRNVKLERDIFKKGGEHLLRERQVRYEFILSNKGYFPVGKMCKCMKVSKSAFYNWLKTKDIRKEKESLEYLKNRITVIFEESNQIYGSRRIQKSLERENIYYSRSYISFLMKKLGLKSVLRKKYILTTDSDHSYEVPKNILNREFTSSQLGEKWVSDITYIRIGNQWYYFTMVLDLADRKVLAWTLSDDMTTENTIYKTWLLAKKRRAITKHHIFHSDRGVQYASNTMKKLLGSNLKISQSISRKGNCWDNAVAESFFKTLKYECVYRHKFKSFLEAHYVIDEYIKWYNTKRLHSSLGYKTPLEVEQEYLNIKNKKVA